MSKPPPVFPPRLLTRRAIIGCVAERWRAQYCHAGQWSECMGGPASAIYDKLVALDLETAGRDVVDEIIGNHSWTAIQCDGCQRDVARAAQVGQLPDYDSATVVLCADCLALAVELLSVRPQPPHEGP